MQPSSLDLAASFLTKLESLGLENNLQEDSLDETPIMILYQKIYHDLYEDNDLKLLNCSLTLFKPSGSEVEEALYTFTFQDLFSFLPTQKEYWKDPEVLKIYRQRQNQRSTLLIHMVGDFTDLSATDFQITDIRPDILQINFIIS